jgi:RNA polymerase sigma-54 factor
VSTPRGTVELRRFFLAGVRAAGGEVFTQEEVFVKLKALVNAEDRRTPLSDEKLAQALKAEGFPVARRTVAKYRDRLAIPGAAARRCGN